METIYEEINGNNGVKIQQDKYGTYLCITTNGWQWAQIVMNEEIFQMIKRALEIEK